MRPAFGSERATAMSEDLLFLRAVLNHPSDDTVRLVYADWLQERDDPRAEYLRLEVKRQHSPDQRAAFEKQMGDLAAKFDHRWAHRIWSTRELPPGARQDLVTVADGKGLIEVRGQSEAVLLVEGKPVALNWYDLKGSVGQYLVFTGHTRGADYAHQLRKFVDGAPDESRYLAEQIEPLLALFAPGTYSIEYTPSEAGEPVYTIECLSPAHAAQELFEYYPVRCRNLVCTQVSESLDAGRVEFFRERIRAGFRPVVLITSAERTYGDFVIDGHHKLAAYRQERVQPAILSITREGAPEISLSEGLGWLPPDHPGVPEYRRVKDYMLRLATG